MNKISTTINLTKAARDYIDNKAKRLLLTNSVLIESLAMNYAFNNNYIPSAAELDNLRKSFLMNGASNLTGDFRDQISTFDSDGQTNVIRFFYCLNLIEGFKLSSLKQSNFFKWDGVKWDELCYFALGQIGRGERLVNDYLASFNLITATIGTPGLNSNQYVFFSNIQQFKVAKPYPLFSNLLSVLNLPLNTQVIRVHQDELLLLADAIAKV